MVATTAALTMTNACTTASGTEHLAAGYGRLTGHVGPGAPPNGTVPAMTLRFSNGSETVSATVKNGSYQVDLPAGTWDVRCPAGVCASGISVTAGAWGRNDLGYPIGGCQNLSGPPTPSTPPPPANPVTVPVESEYGDSESFCAVPPLSGRITYEVNDAEATLQLDVRGCPMMRRSAWIGSITTSVAIWWPVSPLTAKAQPYRNHFGSSGPARSKGLPWCSRLGRSTRRPWVAFNLADITTSIRLRRSPGGLGRIRQSAALDVPRQGSRRAVRAKMQV